MYDVGDTATLTLTVDPADATTLAAVAVTSPTGAPTAPAATPNAERTEWTALLPLTEPGLFTAQWAVTGTGEGTETHEVFASGAVPSAHATRVELSDWLHALPIEGANRVLARASELIDDYVLTGYDTDDQGAATVATVAAALRDATCAQVEQWIEVGEELDITGFPDTTSIMLGRLQITDLPKTLAPRARRILRAEGLLSASTT